MTDFVLQWTTALFRSLVLCVLLVRTWSIAYFWQHDFTPNQVLSCQLSFNMPRITPFLYDEAFRYAEKKVHQIRQLELVLAREGRVLSSVVHSAEGRHQRPAAGAIAKVPIFNSAQLFIEASLYLKKRLHLTPHEAQCLLPQLVVKGYKGFEAIQQCEEKRHIHRCVDSKYRTADGTCNNLYNPQWGAVHTCFDRILQPAYADGLNKPRISITGSSLPNPRVLSNFIHRDINRPSKLTLMSLLWGQFISHDINAAPHWVTITGKLIQCCPKPTHPACRPIPLPSNDEFYSHFGETCMNFVRRGSCAKCTLGHREPMNALTTYLDGSQIYGNNVNQTLSLRTLYGDGKLISTYDKHVGELLPGSTEPFTDQCSIPTRNLTCFRGGDSRVNQHPGLAMMHTIWMRQHNRLAEGLRLVNPHWSDEKLFQEARRIVGAQLQMITYNEFLPGILGPDYMTAYKLYPQDHGYTMYDHHRDPSILIEFEAAAYRFGHSLVLSLMGQRDAARILREGRALRQVFFFPFNIYNTGLDDVINQFITQRSQKVDTYISNDVRNHLYAVRGRGFGLDLPAINIHRGRDNGVPAYSNYLHHFFGKDVKDFDDLSDLIRPELIKKFKQVYHSVHDIDLFTGGLAESPVDEGAVGPTFASIIGEQFNRLKYGDRYYFEHGAETGTFTIPQLDNIRETTLAKVLCENEKTIDLIRFNTLEEESYNNPEVACHTLPDIDYTLWKH